MKSLSVAIVSGPVGTTPDDIIYSFVFEEAHGLTRRGINVHMLRLRVEDDFLSYGMYYHGVERKRKIDSEVVRFAVKSLPAYPFLSLTRKPSYIYIESRCALNVSKVVEKNNIDIIHAHFAYPEGLFGLLAKRKSNKPLIVTVHGYDILVESSVGYGIRLDKRVDSLVRVVLNGADAVLTASKATLDEAKKIVNDTTKIHLIPNGINVERFNPKLDGSPVKRNLSIGEERMVVFTLRSHEPKYGVEYLLRAIPMVIKSGKNAIFVIGGDGSLRNFHERLAMELGVEDDVIFTGGIPQKDIPYYYAMSDVVVVPSIQEAFGLVVSEAMACAKPVIGSNVGGIPDQIIDGCNGFLVPPCDPKGIAERIIYLLENPHVARRMGVNGRRIVEEKFDIRKRIERIIALYERIVNGRN